MGKNQLYLLAFVALLVALVGDAQGQSSAAPDSPAVPESGTATAGSQAVVPRLMKFSGTLRDMAGKPISGAGNSAQTSLKRTGIRYDERRHQNRDGREHCSGTTLF